MDQIQCEFKIENSEAGLLQTVFVVSYMLFAPLFGYLGDRYSRKWIMAAGVFLWSLTTLLGSFMTVSLMFCSYIICIDIYIYYCVIIFPNNLSFPSPSDLFLQNSMKRSWLLVTYGVFC